MVSSAASHFGVQEECHSRVQDPGPTVPLQQKPGFGIEKSNTKVQEDHSEQKIAAAADERSEQMAA